MADPTYVQVNAPGSGAKVATEEVAEPRGVDASGNAQSDVTLEQQRVSVADDRGQLIEDRQGTVIRLLEEILEELRKMNMALS